MSFVELVLIFYILPLLLVSVLLWVSRRWGGSPLGYRDEENVFTVSLIPGGALFVLFTMMFFSIGICRRDTNDNYHRVSA